MDELCNSAVRWLQGPEIIISSKRRHTVVVANQVHVSAPGVHAPAHFRFHISGSQTAIGICYTVSGTFLLTRSVIS